ncbi:MAG TPA: hypothetical protein VE988_07455 [Gemmataceae bacterium]|nr:hypothetical protein [Gemmataceae bacterium]
MALAKEAYVFTGVHLNSVPSNALSADASSFAVRGGPKPTGYAQIMVWDIQQLVTPMTRPKIKLSREVLESYWEDFGKSDLAAAYQAQIALFAGENQAFPLFKKQLSLAMIPDKDGISHLIHNLNNDAYITREKATAALAACGEYAVPMLQAALKSPACSPEAKERIRAILNHGRSKQMLQFLRAIDTVERWGSVDALRFLETLAKGPHDIWLTGEAQAAAERVRLSIKARSKR